jgi:hypothetical protein
MRGKTKLTSRRWMEQWMFLPTRTLHCKARRVHIPLRLQRQHLCTTQIRKHTEHTMIKKQHSEHTCIKQFNDMQHEVGAISDSVWWGGNVFLWTDITSLYNRILVNHANIVLQIHPRSVPLPPYCCLCLTESLPAASTKASIGMLNQLNTNGWQRWKGPSLAIQVSF